MASQTIEASAIGYGAGFIIIDPLFFHYGVGLSVWFASGTTGTVSVEYTHDAGVFSGTYNQATGRWIEHPVLKTLTGSLGSSLQYPCTAVRLNVAGISAGGRIALGVTQVGQ